VYTPGAEATGKRRPPSRGIEHIPGVHPALVRAVLKTKDACTVRGSTFRPHADVRLHLGPGGGGGGAEVGVKPRAINESRRAVGVENVAKLCFLRSAP